MLTGGLVLVPLDGSPLADGALPYAQMFARTLESRLALMTAAYVSEIPGYRTWTKEFEDQPRDICEKYLDDVRTRIGEAAAVTVVRVGYPHEEIAKAADDLSATMIVASTHGRSGVSRWVYGSTAAHMLRTIATPILVVGPEAIGSAGTPPQVTNIMVALDGSSNAELALAPAIELATAFGARVTLVRAVPWAVQAFPYFTPSLYTPELDAELQSSAQAYLDGKRGVFPSGVTVNAEVRRGAAADSLLTFEDEHGIDLVVMTTHARAGIARAVLGSTADRVIHGRAPVLLIRPTGQD